MAESLVAIVGGKHSEISTPAQGVVDASMNAVVASAALLSGPGLRVHRFGGLSWGVLALSVIVALMAFTLPHAAWQGSRRTPALPPSPPQ